MSSANNSKSGDIPGGDAFILMGADMTVEALYVPTMDDNKYSRGVVGLVTGSDSYPGAAVLSCLAAARAGAGLVRYTGPERAQNTLLAALPEAVMASGRVNAWVVGCGVPDEGANDEQRKTIAHLLGAYSQTEQDGSATARPMQDSLPPIVVDAGALTLLPKRVSRQVIITPHAGELARLLNRLQDGSDLTAEDILSAPTHYATLAHELTGATTLLKGGLTIVAGASGAYVVGNAPSWLSTAGAGDVLAGIIGALLAQNAFSDDAPCLDQIVASAAFLHGMAASFAAHCNQCALMDIHMEDMTPEEQEDYLSRPGHPIVASDVIHAIPVAIEDLLADRDEYEDEDQLDQ